ncbi:MAG TPA: tyrosinase family protein [Mycobacteriales bacterium]|nr:tyrosinase family protein [Mycobacteriales bacterium]
MILAETARRRHRRRTITRIRTVVLLLVVIATFTGMAPVGATAADVVRGDLVRRNVKELSPDERTAFVDAVLALKQAPSPFDARYSYYDQFVVWHVSLYRCSGQEHDIRAGHGGPFFLPWHRAFVLLFEKALRDVSHKRIAVPYWDWSDPESTAVVFADDFMGDNGDPSQGYAVTTGPFRKDSWTLHVRPEMAPWAQSYQPHLVRKFGSGGITALPPVADVAWALTAPEYDAAPYDMSVDPNRSFRNALEGWWRADPAGRRFADPLDHTHCGPDDRVVGSRDAGRLHNQVHSWTGGIVAEPVGAVGPTIFGTMLMPTSPSDPVFFLHHSNIDRLWAKWQGLHAAATFQPAGEASTPMQPFAAAGRFFSAESVRSPTGLGYTYSDFTDSDDRLVAPAALSDRATPVDNNADAQPLVCRLPT